MPSDPEDFRCQGTVCDEHLRPHVSLPFVFTVANQTFFCPKGASEFMLLLLCAFFGHDGHGHDFMKANPKNAHIQPIRDGRRSHSEELRF